MATPLPTARPAGGGESPVLTRAQAVWIVVAATALGGLFRFYGLSWGAPYFHFHIDEHFVFTGAEMLRRNPDEAAQSAKFFMYSPGPMYLLNVIVSIYEALAHRLVLTVPSDQVTYMVLGRAISATLGTATIPLIYLVGARLGGRLAGAMAALLFACSVSHLRESHFFSVDVTMTLCVVLAWYYLIRTVERPHWTNDLGAGLAIGLGLASKYTAAFTLSLVPVAYLLSDLRPRRLRPLTHWVRLGARAAVPAIVAAATFLLLDPLAIRYYAKFRSDIREWITDPLLGNWKPIWIAQFADINPTTYWVTNLLWWGLGPALEVAGLAAVAWLLTRRRRVAAIAAAFPIAYWLLAGRSIAPMFRYSMPLAPGLAVAAALLFAAGLAHARWRRVTAVVATLTMATTALWAIAYMNVYRSPDSRLTASAWLMKNVPAGSRILVEPSHNIPPTGGYLTNVNFFGDYVLWGPNNTRKDHFELFTLDTYRTLYNRGPSDADRQRYIDARLALADWIVTDDTFLQFYQHLPEADHAVVKRFYRDLFAERLGFRLVKSFKVYPSLFGKTINDDGAELTFRLFDHPRVFVFMRQ